MPWVVADFESASQCDLKRAGAWRYWEDVTTEALCLAFEFSSDLGGGNEIWYPGDPIPPRAARAVADDGTVFLAHNADFEKAGWRSYMVALLGWPDIPNRRWHDTAARCANLTVARGLDKALKQLNLPVEKDMEGNRLTLGLSRIDKKTGMLPEITPEIRERVGTYCLGDVRGQAALHRRVGWLPAGERVTYLLDQEINERGVRLDVPLIAAMRKVVDRASAPLAQEFAEITGGLKMTQRDKVMSWLLDQGVQLPDMTKDTLDRVIGENEDGEEIEDAEDVSVIDMPPHALRALKIRRLIGSASIKKLGAMEACVCSDGRARGLLMYHGAGTGRWSGRLLQPQNFPRGTIEEDGVHPDIEPLVAAVMTGDPEYVEACYGPAVETVVSSLRHVLIASPGCELVAGDYSGIEARTVLALAGQHDKTALMASGADVYIDMALDIFGMPKFDVSNKELVKKFKAEHTEKRQFGKNTVLGCGFQMGARKFFGRYCSTQTMGFAEQIIKTYRTVWAPEVPKLWYALQEAAIDTVWTGRPHEAYGCVYALEDEWLTCLLPSGRKLWYFRPQKTRRPMPWDENDIRPGFSYQAWKMGRLITVDAYGGLLCLGPDTEVLTHRGFMPIVDVQHTDKLWDGEDWVSHDGLTYQGVKEVLNFGGIWMTPDHEVLEDGWKPASDCSYHRANAACEALGGQAFRELKRSRIPGAEQDERKSVGNGMRLRSNEDSYPPRSSIRRYIELWMPNPRTKARPKTGVSDPLYVEASGLRCMAVDAGSMQVANAPSLGELRRPRHYSMPAVEELRKLLGRHGAGLLSRIANRKNRQQPRLFSRELPLGYPGRSSKEPADECISEHAPRNNDPIGRSQDFRDKGEHALLAEKSWMVRRSPVYDLVNAGPRKRFTVRGADRREIIVHNCENVVQALARDILRDALIRCRKENMPVVLTVHDEIVCDIEARRSDPAMLKQIMEDVQPWTRALKVPIETEVWSGQRYRK